MDGIECHDGMKLCYDEAKEHLVYINNRLSKFHVKAVIGNKEGIFRIIKG